MRIIIEKCQGTLCCVRPIGALSFQAAAAAAMGSGRMRG